MYIYALSPMCGGVPVPLCRESPMGWGFPVAAGRLAGDGEAAGGDLLYVLEVDVGVVLL